MGGQAITTLSNQQSTNYHNMQKNIIWNEQREQIHKNPQKKKNHLSVVLLTFA